MDGTALGNGLQGLAFSIRKITIYVQCPLKVVFPAPTGFHALLAIDLDSQRRHSHVVSSDVAIERQSRAGCQSRVQQIVRCRSEGLGWIAVVDIRRPGVTPVDQRRQGSVGAVEVGFNSHARLQIKRYNWSRGTSGEINHSFKRNSQELSGSEPWILSTPSWLVIHSTSCWFGARRSR